MARRLAAIMFTDIAGYTSLSQRDEVAALRLQRDQETLARPLLATHHGRRVKSTGDGLLLEFSNARDAVEFGVEFQRNIHERNSLVPEPQLQIRIGIHLGDVQRKGPDILGDAVNIASRIEPLATPGGVCLSEPVYLQIRNQTAYRLESLGEKTLKGLEEPMEVYRVLLPWLAASPARADGGPGPSRLAVLPLVNISQDPKDEYFADGLTEELITALSQVRNLRVISRTSVNQYRGTTKSVAQIGNELGAGWILEGSVRRSGDQLRITVQLIDTRADEHAWSQSYDRKLEDVFTVQGDVAARIAAALRLRLAPSDKQAIQEGPSSSVDAWDCYLRGIYFSTQEGTSAFHEALRWFEKATTKDPSFGVAYAWWGYLYALAPGWDLPGTEAFPRARELIGQASRLAPEALETHLAKGVLALRGDMDWSAAEREFQTAISINPSHAGAHFWLGVTHFTTGGLDAANEEFRTTIQLDPQNTDAWDWLMLSKFRSGDFDAAVSLGEVQRDRNPSSAAIHARLAYIYAQLGRHADAMREAKLMRGNLSGFVQAVRAGFFAWNGEPSEARALLTELEKRATNSYVPLFWRIWIHLSLRERQQALELIERDEQEGDHLLWFYYWLDWCNQIRDDPRFLVLLRQRGLPEAYPPGPVEAAPNARKPTHEATP